MILIRSKSRLIIMVAHVLIWAVFGIAIFFYHPLFSGIEIPLQAWITQSITLSLLVIAFYVNASVLVPGFLLKSRAGYYFLMIVAIVAIIVFIIGWAHKALVPNEAFNQAVEFLQPPRLRRPVQDTHIERPTIILTVLVLGVSTSIAVIQKWQKVQQKREELEKEKVTSELSLLKAQINPHFFFNTLNNIYALTSVDAALAGKAIHQLSRMMRYFLYGTQPGHTMLSQEIAFVKDYISLMQLRMTDVLVLCVDTPADLEDLPLAPMIFLPFVENAFKHGVSATKPCNIDVIILQMAKVLELTVKNSIVKDNSVSLDTNDGIGLANTRRRLDLLYPGKYKLDINELNADNEYTVHLILDLS